MKGSNSMVLELTDQAFPPTSIMLYLSLFIPNILEKKIQKRSSHQIAEVKELKFLVFNPVIPVLIWTLVFCVSWK